MHAQKITDALFARGKGGFWVRADGFASGVGYEGHSARARVYGFETYEDAWEAGWVRMSNPHGHLMLIEFTKAASIDALCKTARLLRHRHGLDGIRFSIWAPGFGDDRKYAAEDRGKLASKLMQIVLEKSAAAKAAAAAQAEAAAAQAEAQHELEFA